MNQSTDTSRCGYRGYCRPFRWSNGVLCRQEVGVLQFSGALGPAPLGLGLPARVALQTPAAPGFPGGRPARPPTPPLDPGSAVAERQHWCRRLRLFARGESAGPTRDLSKPLQPTFSRLEPGCSMPLGRPWLLSSGYAADWGAGGEMSGNRPWVVC